MPSKDFKKKNFDTSVRVSEQSIQKLRSGKTFENNIANAKKSGVSAQDREALNRFYGKSRVSSALGTGASTTSNNAMTGIKASNVGPAYNASMQNYTKPGSIKGVGSSFKGVSTSGYKAPRTATPNRSGMNKAASGAGNFVKNELLGVDDFSKLRGQMKNRQFKNMAKSIGEGSFELGTTVGAVLAAIPTGGASLAGKAALVAAKQGAKTGTKKIAKDAIKASAKESAKTVVSKTGKVYAEASVKKATVGTVKGGYKVAKGTVKAPVKGYKGAKGAYKSAKSTLEAERYAKSSAGLGEARAMAAAAAAKKVTATATGAGKAAKKATATASKMTAAGKGTRPVKGTAAAVKSAASSAAARDAANAAARKANKSAGNIGKMAASRTSKAAAEKAAKEARKKKLRGVTKTNLKIRGAGAAVNYYNNN